MKRIKFALLTVIFLTGTLVKGQESRFSIGIEGGPGISSLRGNEWVENFYDPALSYTLGLSAEYALNNLLSIRSGVTYEAKGAKANVTYTDVNGNTTGNGKFEERFNYLNFPLMLRYKVGKKVKCFINTGPYIAVLLKEITRAEAFGDFRGFESNNSDLYKKIDFGITAGIGAIFPLNDKISISTEIRDNFGLANLSKQEIADGGSIKINNASLLVGLAYHIPNH
ncbi:MAG: PorT family protein [Bacteroidales bacterium]|nr:PorT family protein [Bacteroidales bacterium]